LSRDPADRGGHEGVDGGGDVAAPVGVRFASGDERVPTRFNLIAED
jgi:hypothetical protein